jgi:hypothetical protein
LFHVELTDIFLEKVVISQLVRNFLKVNYCIFVSVTYALFFSYNIVIFFFPVHATWPDQCEPVDFIISVAKFIVPIFALLQKWDIRVIIVFGQWAGCPGNCG